MVGWEGGEGLLSKNSLQDFTLISEAEEYQQMDDSAHSPENISVPPFGSLLEFRQLRRLDATISVLVGREDPSDTQTDVLANANIDAETLKHEQNLQFVESLPESLEERALRSCFRDIYAAMETLFEKRRRGGLKRLKKVLLFFHIEFD